MPKLSETKLTGSDQSDVDGARPPQNRAGYASAAMATLAMMLLFGCADGSAESSDSTLNLDDQIESAQIEASDDESSSDGVDTSVDASTGNDSAETDGSSTTSSVPEATTTTTATTTTAGITTTSGATTTTSPTSVTQPEVVDDAPYDPAMTGLVTASKEDLASRLETQTASVAVVSARMLTWPDSAIGCPARGKSYAPALTDGSEIVLVASGANYRYTSGGAIAGPTLCEN